MFKANRNSAGMRLFRGVRLRNAAGRLCLALGGAFLASVAGARAQGPIPQRGVGLVAPPGWIVQAPDAARISVRGPDGVSSIVIVAEDGTLASAQERFSQTLVLPTLLLPAVGELIPLGPPRRRGSMVSNRFLAPGGAPAHRAIVLARETAAGRLIVLYGLTQPGLETDLNTTMLHLAAMVGLPSEPGWTPEGDQTAPKQDRAE
jgi:hypothetical protein